jgi:hypothetical protein
VRKVLDQEVDLRADGTKLVQKSQLPSTSPSITYNAEINADGSPSQSVSAGYQWQPGTELARRAA